MRFIFAGLNVCGFCGLAAICESFVHENEGINVYHTLMKLKVINMPIIYSLIPTEETYYSTFAVGLVFYKRKAIIKRSRRLAVVPTPPEELKQEASTTLARGEKNAQ